MTAASAACAHYRATDIASDNRIAPGATAESEYRFALPTSDTGTLTVRLVRRRYAAPIADLYGWDVDDTELATFTQTLGASE